ncbi:MAG: ribosome maturation factor RimP [Cardiobacteriaceae bacterium]|nr:ribosome maturation factor RimP [Cardiobacteriaceae bacterium]
MSIEEKIREIITPTIEDMNLILWGIEFHRNSVNSVLRVYLDRVEGGITLDEIVLATERLNPILDVENPIESAYSFEVSSPGLDRPLFTIEQYAQMQGAKIKLRTRLPIERQRKFTGILQSVNTATGEITLFFPDAKAGKERQELSINFSDIDRCQIEPEF